jgi:hypothetical protein
MKGDRPYGRCHYCGEWQELTEEHVPPRKAFNSTTTRPFKPAGKNIFDPRTMSLGKQKQGGVSYYRLCRKCNSDTGAWYGGAYHHWAIYGASLIEHGIGLSPVYHETLAEPGRIAKQIIGMFLTINGIEFGDTHEDLRRYVLQRRRVGIPEEFALYCYLTRSQQYRVSGFISKRNLESRETEYVSEISHFPFGYLLYYDSRPRDQRLFDISWFTRKRFDSVTDVQLRLQQLPVHSAMPTDFRSFEDMEKSRDKHKNMKPSEFPGSDKEFREEQIRQSTISVARLEQLGSINPTFVTADPNLADEAKSRYNIDD